MVQTKPRRSLPLRNLHARKWLLLRTVAMSLDCPPLGGRRLVRLNKGLGGNDPGIAFVAVVFASAYRRPPVR